MGKLRLLLAVSVIIAHSSPILGTSLIGGAHAVHAFYMISGFYMSMILNEKYRSPKDYKLFISNRFLRLYPIYWIVLFVSVLLTGFLFKNSGNTNEQYIMYSQYFGSVAVPWKLFLVMINLVIFGQDIIMFSGLNTQTGHLYFTKNFRQSTPAVYSFLFVPQAWTLALELTFYMIAPFLLRRSIKLIATIILIAFSFRFIAAHYGLNYDPWDNRFFLFEIGFFLLGNIAYRIYRYLLDKKIDNRYYYSTLIFIFLLIILFYHLPFKTPLLYTAIFLSIPVLFLGSKKSKTDRFFGDLSYPVYISHFLLLEVMEYFGMNRSGIILSALSILFSIILNELVSKKIELIRQRRVRKELQPQPVENNLIPEARLVNIE
jgi:peptidoglycan/LPS O-acetylase OafA/YrhL